MHASPRRPLAKPLSTLLAAALLAPAAPARAGEQAIELRSNGSYQSYRLPQDTEEVQLDRQLAGNCRFNRSWGYDLTGRELWVNNGCEGRFKVRTRGDGDSSSSSSNTAAAVVAVAAIAGLALLAHNSSKRDDERNDNNPPAYPDWGASAIRGQSGLCLDVEGGLRRGSRLIVYRCQGSANQDFRWSRRGEIRVGNLCVDVANGDTRDGASLIAWDCNGGDNQRWSARGGQIRSEMSGKCMDISEGRARPGQPVIAYRCNGGANQRWSW
jgi:hypothetical protein